MSTSLLPANVIYTQECLDNQISCDISSDAECRLRRDRTSRACETTWSKGCCIRDCKPDPETGGRVCKIAPPSEEYFGLSGFADIEDYAGDEALEEFDSEDEDLDTEISADSEDEDSESEDAAFEDSEDMILYSGSCYYDGWSNGMRIRTSRDLSNCCRNEFDDCKYDKRDGYSVPNCARQRQQCDRQVSLAQVA